MNKPTEWDGVNWRPLRIRDMRFCYRLASEPDIRANSFDDRMPNLIGHILWMERWMMRGPRKAWVIIGPSGDRVGLLRAEGTKSGRAVVSIAIAGQYRGNGFALETLRSMTPMIQRQFGEAVAYITAANVASKVLFREAGYRFSHRLEDGVAYVWDASE